MKKIVFIIIILSFISFGCDNFFYDDIDGTNVLIPTNITASKGTSSHWINVSWNSDDNMDSYEVWRSTEENSNYSYLETTYFTSITDDTVTECIIYYYKIIAVDNDLHKSSMSSHDYGYKDGFPDSCPDGGINNNDDILPPANIVAADGENSTVVNIDWSSVSAAVRYGIYRSLSLSGSYVWIGETNSPSYSDWTIDECIIYYYKVKSIDSNDNISEFSNADSGYGEKFGEGTCP